jgi:hypothetical protein
MIFDKLGFKLNTSKINPNQVLKHFITGGATIALLSTMVDTYENNLLVAILYAGFPFTGFYLVWVAHENGGAKNAYDLTYHFLWTSIIITCAFYLFLLITLPRTSLSISMLLSTLFIMLLCVVYYKMNL